MEGKNIAPRMILLMILGAILIELVATFAMFFSTFNGMVNGHIYIMPPEQVTMIEHYFSSLEVFFVTLTIIGFLCAFLGMTVLLRALLKPLRNEPLAKVTFLHGSLLILVLMLSLAVISVISTVVTLSIPHDPSNVKLLNFVSGFFLVGVFLGQSFAKILVALLLPLKQGYLITIGNADGQPALVKMKPKLQSQQEPH